MHNLMKNTNQDKLNQVDSDKVEMNFRQNCLF
jgi:hypothetical protein